MTRVFFSFHVPQEVGERLLTLVKHPNIQLYPVDNLHITLKFIGPVSQDQVNQLATIAAEVAAAVLTIHVTPKRFVVADDRLRLEMERSPDLLRLRQMLYNRIAQARIGKLDDVEYAPHVTLGRLQGDVDVAQFSINSVESAFPMSGFGLYKSEPGEDKLGQYTLLKSFTLGDIQKRNYTKIVLPTRAQPDTVVAIFILKKFGSEIFPGIKEAAIDFWQIVPDGETEETLDKKGVLLLDLGGGRFDHHAYREKTTASDLVADYLGVQNDPSLAKLLEYARRDDFYGKGTISNDPIDRAFGLSALIASLNKSLVKNPGRVIEIVLPLIIAHHAEEERRTKELPLEFEQKLKNGEATVFDVNQRDKKLKVVVVTSDSGSMAGYLRSQNGGRFDVVAQWLPSGHVNILTRPTKRVDLRSLAALLRIEEATRAGLKLDLGIREFARTGRMPEVPDWYYDPATNSIQNGGLNPKEVKSTRIDQGSFKKILELGLSEQVWDPRQL